MNSDSPRPCITSAGVTANLKATWVNPLPSVLTEYPLKNTYASSAPSTPPEMASASASAITEAITGQAPKPSARSVPISAVRADTAEYIVLSAPNVAPTAITSATKPASTPITVVRLPDWPLKKSRSVFTSTLSCGLLVRRSFIGSKPSVLASLARMDE